MTFAGAAVPIALAAALLLISDAAAYMSYQTKIPNGANVARNGVTTGGVGHAAAGGAGALNPFGTAFAAASYTWTSALCNADADGDGHSNGAELGDPGCTWAVGGTPSRTTDITHPGFSDSFPATTAVPTPVPPNETAEPSTAAPSTSAPTTAAPTTPQPTAAAFSTANQLIASATQSALSGKVTFQWTIYDAADAASTNDDVLELVMSSAADDTYVAFGTAPEKMSGPFVACVVSSATAVASCSDWTGSEYAAARRATAAGAAAHAVVASGKLSGGGFTVTLRMLASALKIGAASQRAIAAAGVYSVATNEPYQHAGAAMRQGLTVDMRAGTASTAVTTASSDLAFYLSVVACLAWLVTGVLLRVARVKCSELLKKAFAVLTALLVLGVVAAGGLGATLDNEVNGVGKVLPRAVGRATSMCMVLVLFPVPKHLAVAGAVGSSFERAVPYHAFIGSLMFLLSTVHLVLMWVEMPDAGDVFKWDTVNFTNAPLAGFLAWLLMAVMIVPAWFIRRKAYSVFRALHMLWPAVVVLAMLHSNKLGVGMVVPLLNLAADSVVRLHSHYSHAAVVVRARAEGDCVELVVRTRLPAAIPGNFAVIALRDKMPTAHPFSIASYDREKGEAHFFIKAIGPWTRELLAAVQAAPAGAALAREPVVWQGPYGALEVPLGATPAALLVGGGIGFTPLLSLMEHVAAQAADGGAPLPIARLSVVWVLRDAGLLRLMQAELTRVAAQLEAVPGLAVTLAIQFTGPEGDAPNAKARAPFHRVVEGRPDVAALLGAVAPAAGDAVTVYCCGPAPLMGACAKAVGARDGPTFLHTETFEM
jgi:predicted ferric reductase